MKALFVDENRQQVAGAIKALERDGWDCAHCTFADAQGTAHEFAPDLLVLDLMNGGAEDDPEGESGNTVFKEMLNESFCPIIVYSANPSLLQDADALSPLIALVQKGTGAHDRIKAAAIRLLPAIEAVTLVRREVYHALEKALVQFIPLYVGEDAKIKIKGDAKMYVYLARRRVAAMLDEMAADGGPLQVWEQYLYPALGRCPLQGDLLSNGNTDDPSTYRLVLTPSCDLDMGECREPKVDRILVAKCTTVAGVLKSDFQEPDSNKKTESVRKRLTDALIGGLGESAIPLPAVPGVFPDMAADLKKLELLDYSKDGQSISGKNGRKAVLYRRIASVDSPFREQMAWNYQRVACRPGMPDRDIQTWATAVAKRLQKETEEKKKSEGT